MRWLAAVLLAGTLQGDSTPRPGAEPGATLAPLEFLVGSCWKGTFPDGRKTDEHCFEWMLGRRFIRDRHVVEGGEPYRGESVLGWDTSAKRMGFWYWNSDGLVTVGSIEYRDGGVVFPERYTGPEGEVELEAIWSRRGKDAYHVLQRRRTPKGWETLWTMELRRQG
jgi:hypothetical protein